MVFCCCLCFVSFENDSKSSEDSDTSDRKADDGDDKQEELKFDGYSSEELSDGQYYCHWGYIPKQDIMDDMMFNKGKTDSFPLFMKFHAGQHIGMFVDIGYYTCDYKYNCDKLYENWRKMNKVETFIKNVLNHLWIELTLDGKFSDNSMKNVSWQDLVGFSGLFVLDNGNGEIISQYCTRSRSGHCLFGYRAPQSHGLGQSKDNGPHLLKWHERNASCSHGFKKTFFYCAYVKDLLNNKCSILDLFGGRNFRNGLNINMDKVYESKEENVLNELVKCFGDNTSKINFRGHSPGGSDCTIMYAESPKRLFGNGYSNDTGHFCSKNSGKRNPSGYAHSMTERGLNGKKYCYIGKRKGLLPYSVRVGYKQFLCGYRSYNSVSDYIVGSKVYDDKTDCNLNKWKKEIRDIFNIDVNGYWYSYILYPTPNPFIFDFNVDYGTIFGTKMVFQMCRVCHTKWSNCSPRQPTIICNDSKKMQQQHFDSCVKPVLKSLFKIEFESHKRYVEHYEMVLFRHEEKMKQQQQQQKLQQQQRLQKEKQKREQREKEKRRSAKDLSQLKGERQSDNTWNNVSFLQNNFATKEAELNFENINKWIDDSGSDEGGPSKSNSTNKQSTIESENALFPNKSKNKLKNKNDNLNEKAQHQKNGDWEMF